MEADRLLDYPLSIYRRSEAFYTKGDVVSQMELAKRPAPPRSSTKRSRPAVSHARKSAKKGSKKGVKEDVKEEGVKEEVKEEGVKEESVKEEGVKEESVKEEGAKEETKEEVKEEGVKDVKEEEVKEEGAKEETKEEVKEEEKKDETKEQSKEEDANATEENDNKPDETKTPEPMDVEQEDLTMEQAQSLQGDAPPEVIILACSPTRLHFWPFPELHAVHAGKRSASIDVTQFAPEVSIEDAAFMDGFDKEGAVVGVACKRGVVLVVDVYQKKLLHNVRIAGWTDA